MNTPPACLLPDRRAIRLPAAAYHLIRTSRVLAAALLAGFATLGAPAQQSGGIISSYSGPPPPSPPPQSENFAFGPSLGPSGRPQSLFDANFYPPGYSNRIIEQPPGPFFLPALLPVLGVPGPTQLKPLANGYPREFAGEPYFMAYGNLAANHELSAARAERIARHRAARLALLAELREQLQRGHDASVLAGLAAAQTPRLLELETEAEKIRHDLTRVELFATPADDIGKLVPIKGHPNDVLGAVRQVLSAAHFRDGFSSDQRRLLEEMAQEIVLTLEPEPAGRPASVFFWPAGARILVPTGLPPAAAAQFAEFQRRKAALKEELRTALERDRNQLFNFDNTEAFARLAARQAPRFAELDAMADQLRPALAADNASEARDRQPVYAAAVLTPGLSPPQRRLLLAAAAGDSLQ